MSLSEETYLRLQAYADGECAEAERADIDLLIASHPEARAFVDSLANLHDVVCDAYALAPAADLTDSILAHVAENAPEAASRAEAPRSNLTDLETARKRRAARARWSAVAVAFSVAAAALLYMKAQTPAAGLAARSSAAASTQGVEVADIDSDGKHDVSVFYLPASESQAASSVVVWIDEKGGL